MELEELEELMINEIKNQSSRKELLNAEQEMLQNQEAMDLIMAFNKAQEEYNFIIRIFPNDESKKKEAHRVLYNAKKKMDEHQKVKKYNELLIQCNEPLRYLEYKLINVFQRKGCKSC